MFQTVHLPPTHYLTMHFFCRWDQLPIWDSSACGRVELEARGHAATKLLTAQVLCLFLISASKMSFYVQLTVYSGVLKVRAEAAALNFEKAAFTRESTYAPEIFECDFREARVLEPPSQPRRPARLLWRLSSSQSENVAKWW